MIVELINYTPEPDKTCAAAALGCHSHESSKELMKEINDKKIKNVLRYTIERGHLSVIEHASFTFSISGVSRALTHQLVRHRIASYSQQSQRYVKMDTPTFVTPPSIKNNEKILSEYNKFMDGAWKTYNFLLKEEIPPEDARFVLPNATTTNITVTMNARELLHFFELRCCMRAQWEIRGLAYMMLKKVKEVAPIIFENAGPSCENCPEPDFPCELRNNFKKKRR
ncbi:MAG TPA: FAD-dependent thymidylate synthase [candidate division Zixibacteria bacterium]|nr:FAD-dependent thymidylate synthase [candidate division Zixibacteria bacterium]